jgi:hypothetical protein
MRSEIVIESGKRKVRQGLPLKLVELRLGDLAETAGSFIL